MDSPFSDDADVERDDLIGISLKKNALIYVYNVHYYINWYLKRK